MAKSTPGLFLGLRTLTQRKDGKIFSSKLASQGDFLSERPALLREGMVGCGRWMVAHLRGSEENETPIFTPSCGVIARKVNTVHKGGWNDSTFRK